MIASIKGHDFDRRLRSIGKVGKPDRRSDRQDWAQAGKSRICVQNRLNEPGFIAILTAADQVDRVAGHA
ncbi:hypothetical protein AN189_07205 [Loktanella sp. 3ANDIMAR09]|nr:hypothetical protein AN189_07205 [Loktanella sp. 3ANDIMAR09]